MSRWLGGRLFAGARAPRLEFVGLIARRELRESTSDTRLLIAMTSLTFVIPLVAAVGVTAATHFLGSAAHGIADRLAEVGAFFVVFLPASFSLVLALESFSGERERNTLETLFATQLRESEIYLGKISAVLLPSLTLSYSALVVYTIAIYVLAGFFPGNELPPLVVVTLAQALVMVTGATIVSSQTKTLRSANVMASFIIIPMSGVIQGESVLIISRLEWVLWGVAVMLGTVALLLLRLGILNFNRENILSKDSRPPDRGAFARRMLGGFPGSPAAAGQWLGHQVRAVPAAYARTLPAVAMSAALLLLGGVMGSVSALSGVIPTGLVAGALRSAAAGNEVVSGSPHLASFIFTHNVLVGVLLLAVTPVSLGVVGGVLMITNGFVVGYLGGYYLQVHHLGFFACGIAPHSVFEIPALVFAYAFALRIAASMVRPSPDGWLSGMRLALADYGRGAMVFVPLFGVAAVVEAYVTTTVIRGC